MKRFLCFVLLILMAAPAYAGDAAPPAVPLPGLRVVDDTLKFDGEAVTISVPASRRYADAAARNAAHPSPTEGLRVVTGGVYQIYESGSWVDYDTWQQGQPGADGQNVWPYLRYAEDDSGTNISTDPTGRPYQAVLLSTSEIATPQASDFTGLWKRVTGLSAYEVAVENGYSGTESQWLASLKGDAGQNFSVDQVGDLSGLSTYDAEAEGFAYLAQDTGNLYIKQSATSGDWSDPIPFQGPAGNTVLSGTGAPDGGLGVDGDFYLDTAASALYGPKATTWPSPVSLLGADGEDGAAGAEGAPGADGRTILHGEVDPTTEGEDGDFYINTASSTLFGPKASGTWPAGVSLIGGTDFDPASPGAIGGTTPAPGTFTEVNAGTVNMGGANLTCGDPEPISPSIGDWVCSDGSVWQIDAATQGTNKWIGYRNAANDGWVGVHDLTTGAIILQPGSIDPTYLADGDYGDFSCASGVCTVTGGGSGLPATCNDDEILVADALEATGWKCIGLEAHPQFATLLASFNAAGLNSFSFTPVTFGTLHEGTYYTTAPFPIGFNVSGSNASYDVASVLYQINSGGYGTNTLTESGVTPGLWEAAGLSAADGGHTLQLQATDNKAGTPNTGESASYAFVVDTTDPVVVDSVATPTDATYAVGVAYDLNVDITEANHSSTTYACTDSGTYSESGSLSVTGTAPNLSGTANIDSTGASGDITCAITSTDLAGNTGTIAGGLVIAEAGGAAFVANVTYNFEDETIPAAWTVSASGGLSLAASASAGLNLTTYGVEVSAAATTDDSASMIHGNLDTYADPAAVVFHLKIKDGSASQFNNGAYGIGKIYGMNVSQTYGDIRLLHTSTGWKILNNADAEDVVSLDTDVEYEIMIVPVKGASGGIRVWIDGVEVLSKMLSDTSSFVSPKFWQIGVQRQAGNLVAGSAIYFDELQIGAYE